MTAAGRATFAGHWQRAVRVVGDRPFLVWDDRNGSTTAWTYREFDGLVDRVAGGLAGHGVGAGAAVHLTLSSSPAFVATWLAAARLGAWIVPADPQSTVPEIAHHLQRTQPVVAVASARRAEEGRHAAAGGPTAVVIVEEDDVECTGLAGDALSWDGRATPGPLDRAAVLFTSGTTSAPKGVEVTQANYAFAGDVMAAASALRAEDRQYVVLPLFHANAQYYSFASAIAVGASVALMPSFSASGYIDAAARHQVTHGSLFAAPMRMMLARDARPVPGFTFRHVWYAQNVTEDQYEDLARRLGCRPRQLYGMTETIPAVLTNPALDPDPLAMGRPTLGCRVDLRRPDGDEPVADGEVGEVVVAGDTGTTLFAGYLDDPVTTADSFRAGWFRTGDLARRDGTGSFLFAGRRGDVLKVSGENVSVVEVEAVLAQHASVLEAAVIGQPDPVRDEVPVAFVVAAPGGPDLDVDDLERWCADHLAPAKRPRRIEVVAELPRTSVGKIRKFLLRDQATATG